MHNISGKHFAYISCNCKIGTHDYFYMDEISLSATDNLVNTQERTPLTKLTYEPT